MVAKGAWLRPDCRPVFIRTRPPSNEHDVRIAAIQAIMEISKARPSDRSQVDRSYDRAAIVKIVKGDAE